MNSESYQRRFSGVARLFGAEPFKALGAANVCVVGLGGVGSWAAEAIVRSGVAGITLVDLDDVCISNVNRQLHALDGQFGRPKVEVMRDRLRTINPECDIQAIQSFFVPSTAEQILATPFDCLLDAIDDARIKALLIASCVKRQIPVITTGGAGGRRDPTAIGVADLAFTSSDALLRYVRKELRRYHGFPRGELPFGVDAVFSREAPVYPDGGGTVCSTKPEDPDLRLDCESGFGTASFVTGAFGFAAASRVVTRLCERGTCRVPSAQERARISLAQELDPAPHTTGL